MRALLPDAGGSVRFDSVPEPVPAPDQVQLAVDAFSVNRGETLLLDRPRAEWRPGKDVAGTVSVPAADGSGPPVGARVVGHPPHSGWAERVAVATTSLAAIPDAVAVTTAAALPLAGLTAVRLLREAGALVGRRLLLTGASGGVGHYVVELAVAAGADVTAVTASPARGERLREFGATTVHQVSDAAGWFDVTMESVGGDSFVEARRKTAPQGRIVWFGQAGGRPTTLDFFDWVDGTAGATIVHFSYERSDRSTSDDLATLVGMVAAGRLHPEIGLDLPWAQTPRVIDDIRARRVRGNAVLRLE